MFSTFVTQEQELWKELKLKACSHSRGSGIGTIRQIQLLRMGFMDLSRQASFLLRLVMAGNQLK